jgi:hypothetical protein
VSLTLPDPILNGVPLTHEELRVIHMNMRIAVFAATSERALDGPRPLIPDRGEYYELAAHGRDRDGSLKASITVHMPWSGTPYTRRVRLVRQSRSLLRVALG